MGLSHISFWLFLPLIPCATIPGPFETAVRSAVPDTFPRRAFETKPVNQSDTFCVRPKSITHNNPLGESHLLNLSSVSA